VIFSHLPNAGKSSTAASKIAAAAIRTQTFIYESFVVMNIPQLERRVIEAAMLRRLKQEIERRYGADAATEIVLDAVRTAALEAGRQFAESAPEGPNLAHFATIIKSWTQGGALDIAEEDLRGDHFTFAVTRCGYVQAYAEMGLDGEFAKLVSCSRDEIFAQGYSPHLKLSRSRTIAQGAPACMFAFRWDEESSAPSQSGRQ
jgi:hypothetical protein